MTLFSADILKFVAAASTAASCQLIASEAVNAVPNSGVPRIKFEQTVYDFGKTSQVEQVTGTFSFSNVGTAPLKVAKPVAQCGCTVASVKPDVLAPGGKGELTFSLHLPRMRAAVQKTITIDCNDPQNPKNVLTIKADYAPLFEVLPAIFNVSLHRGDSTNLMARVVRTDGQPFHLTDLKPSQNWIAATAQPEPGSTNQVLLIHASIRGEGAPRYFAERLDAFIDATNQPAFSIPLLGRLIGDVPVTPGMISLPVAKTK